ncbi:hypothetical protein [Alicyclobacillus acidiphilus]|uniref:hypothetical protein n=1 Tax=Alicyclobacillus acidiphilus TaxID=182455 RepID=UPI000A8BE74C|nr:hypothetical protein [Alicyclobacillus acidiphilus]
MKGSSKKITLAITIGFSFLTLVGCGNSTLHQNAVNTPGTSNSGMKASVKPNLDKTVAYSSAELESLTPEQIAQYRIKHGYCPPFSGENVRRNSLNEKNSILGDLGNYKLTNYKMMDSWEGIVGGKVFQLEVDKSTDGKQYILSSTYGAKAYKPNVFLKPIWITNFTGRYVVFAVPTPANGNPMYALDLTTGALVSSHTNHWVVPMSSAGVGGYGTNITGLTQKYPVFR